MRTLIRAGYVIAHDGREHRLLRDGVVVIEGGRIVHVGPRFDGTADETVDARDRILTPGLISTHAHVSGSPLDRSFIEDRGNPQFWYSGLFEMLPVRSASQDEEAGRACIEFSMGELLRSGCTTVMEIGGQGEDVVEAAGRFGLRVYMGQAFRSGRWVTYDGKRVAWELDEAAGQAGLQRAVEFFKKHDGAHGDLVKCFWSPAQIDTCTPDLLKAAKRWADETKRPYQVHTSQSVVEFNEMVARHGRTPIAWMRELGVLGPNTILGHAIIVGGSSWTNYPAGDVQMMADTGVSVAHAVWVFARRGVLMESFARYRAGGVNMSLGTEATTAADAFDAATVGGARALGRDDLGRVAPGARADLVLWKTASWGMTPLRDPVKNIVYNASAEDIDRVYVDGRVVVEGGCVLAADETKIFAALQAGGERMWSCMAKYDWAGRGADALSPQTYRDWS
jgi:5-methylthioadenosine/S-adenosylhomocysteine deaminase